MILVEILSQLAQIESILIENKGELSPEEEAKMKLFSESLISKVDGYKHFFDRIEMSINYWKAKEHECKRIKKALEANLENAENHLKSIMLTKEVKELEGDEYIFKISPTAGEIEITDEAAAQEVYPRMKTIIEVDKIRLREDLENGIDIKCAKIKQNWKLGVKPKNKAVANSKKKELK